VTVGFIRFVLVGILVFVILRFLTRLWAELRTYLSTGHQPQPGSPQNGKRRENHRDIQEAKFEDVTDKENNDKTPS